MINREAWRAREDRALLPLEGPDVLNLLQLKYEFFPRHHPDRVSFGIDS